MKRILLSKYCPAPMQVLSSREVGLMFAKEAHLNGRERRKKIVVIFPETVKDVQEPFLDGLLNAQIERWGGKISKKINFVCRETISEKINSFINHKLQQFSFT